MDTYPLFSNRYDAGKKLAEKLTAYSNNPDVCILALPRGGVPVAFEVAKKLLVPLDIFSVRKLGVPGQEELAMGALASGGIQVLNEQVIRFSGVSQDVIEKITEQEEIEIQRREKQYRGNRLPLDVRNKIIIFIDDGLATGASMKVALKAIGQKSPQKRIVAVPVSSQETLLELKKEADEVICLMAPKPFHGVGQWYEDFSQTSDEEVKCLLKQLNYRNDYRVK